MQENTSSIGSSKIRSGKMVENTKKKTRKKIEVLQQLCGMYTRYFSLCLYIIHIENFKRIYLKN